jgi:hypothetical protein
MSKPFLYRFSDGAEIEVSDMTNAFMSELVEQHGECLYNGFRDQLESLQLLRANSHKTKTDGFQPGWHPALQMEIRTNEQYQRVLKEKGMVEIGNERQKDPVKKKTAAFTDDVIKKAKEMGATLSDREADRLTGKES